MTQGDFEGLPDDDVEALRRFATRSNYPRGTTIFRQGERPQELLIIEKGELELIYQTRFERLVQSAREALAEAHAKVAPMGKKDGQAKAAKAASTGRFSAQAAPKLIVNNG